MEEASQRLPEQRRSLGVGGWTDFQTEFTTMPSVLKWWTAARCLGVVDLRVRQDRRAKNKLPLWGRACFVAESGSRFLSLFPCQLVGTDAPRGRESELLQNPGEELQLKLHESVGWIQRPWAWPMGLADLGILSCLVLWSLSAYRLMFYAHAFLDKGGIEALLSVLQNQIRGSISLRLSILRVLQLWPTTSWVWLRGRWVRVCPLLSSRRLLPPHKRRWG